MCMTGTSHAPAVAAAWLVARGGAAGVDAAVAACASVRPGVVLSAADAARLRAFVAGGVAGGGNGG
jgi:protein-tyrosine phosphatase